MISRERDALLATIEACRTYFVNPIAGNLEGALVAVAESTGGPVTPPKRFVAEHPKEMSAGERLVWAAIFAKEDSIRGVPNEVIGPDKKVQYHKWEVAMTVSAVECAGGAITRLRYALPEYVKGFGLEDEGTQFLEQMLQQ